MQGRSIEGVIIATARRVDPVFEECIGNDIPFVLVNRTVDRDGVNAVIIDDDLGIRTILDHMLDINHSRIAHVAGPQNTSAGYDRAKVISDYLDSYGLRSDLVETTNRFTVEEGRRAFKSLIARDSDFTAVVAGNDLLALGCMDAIGLLVLDDMSICGYYDILFLERISLALTTVLLPKYANGRACRQDVAGYHWRCRRRSRRSQNAAKIGGPKFNGSRTTMLIALSDCPIPRN